MKFDLQPTTLSNSIVVLSPLKTTDFEQLFAVASDELIWEQHPNKLRYQKEVFKNFFDGAIISEGAFLIQDANTHDIIGSTRFYDFDESENSVLIGYTFMGRKFWGSGINAMVKKLLLQYAFQFVDMVYFHVGATNIRSQKAMEKLGAIKIAEQEVTYFGEDSKLNYIYKINKN